MTDKEIQQLEKVRAKMAQIKVQEQQILAREKKRKKKERTCTLIKKGELIEKYFDCANMNSAEFEIFLKAFINHHNIKELIEYIKKEIQINGINKV